MRYLLDERRSKRGYSVKLHAEKNGQRVTIGTGVYVRHLNDFIGGQLMETDVNYKYNLMRLEGIKESLRDALRQTDDLKAACMVAVKGGSLESYQKEIKMKRFVPALKEFMERKRNQGTKTCYEQTLKKLMAYDKDITFERMTPDWLTRFDEELSKTMSINGRAIVMRNIRAVWNYALDMEITSAKYPFKRTASNSSKFGIRHEQTRKRNVPIELLRRLKDYPCEPFQEPYRDLFMLMVYLQGIDIVDVLHLKKSSLVGDRIEYVRQKTDKENASERRVLSVKVYPEAMELIEKLKGENWLLYPLERYKEVHDYARRMNKALGSIGKVFKEGCRTTGQPLIEGLTTKWSRHTWATLAAELDIPEEIIGRALGHSQSKSVTRIYINYDQRKVDDANRKVIDYICKAEKSCRVVSMFG